MGRRNFYVLFFSLLLVSMPVYATPTLSTSDLDIMVKQTKVLHDKAAANEGGWRITEKFLKKSKKFLAKGDKRKALDAATRAREFAELSGNQAAEQKKNWSEPPYLK